MFEIVPFVPLKWMNKINSNIIPLNKIKLSNLPTPIHLFQINEFTELGIELWIKRDDLTSNDLSGNKVRKLEFLLARAIEGSHDCVITIGGEQSNHCRATAAATRQLGLEPYLILRTKTPPNELPLTGNLLINRMVGSNIRTVHPDIYYQVGGNYLISKLSQELKESGKNPYCIPVGGSNVLGTFGYLLAVQEIISSYCHCNESICICECPYQHIVFSCGSGGTAAGLAIGFRLAGVTSTKVHAVGVCDSPEEFYQIIGDIAIEMGLDISSSNGIGNPTEWIHLHQGKGDGYAISTDDELKFLYNVSSTTGIILDSVYSGKAFYYFYDIVKNSPDIFKRGDKVLFIHTGGLFGLYGVEQQLRSLLPTNECVKSLEI